MQAIATRALERDTGARALRGIIEELMLDLMYELPEQKEEKGDYEITADMVKGETEATLFAAQKRQKESA